MDYYEVDHVDQRIDNIPDYEMYEPSTAEVWATCAWPSIEQILKYCLPFIFWNIAFRITTQTFHIPQPLQHISSIICGLSLSYTTLGVDFSYSLIFTLVEYIVLLSIPFVKQKKYGIILTIFCLAVLISGEILDTAVLTWHRMRGTQMIAAVKIISIGFDIDRKLIRYSPNFLEFWGYILCPGNVIMGPWCAYNDYLNIFNRSKWSYTWIFQVILNGVIAIFFLLASNCFIDAYVPDFHSAWGGAYKGALSFRCSHYFVCFLSHCTMLMAGLGTTRQKQNRFLGYSITRPWLIELPRSLVDVVVSWNLSMHYWLKTYVFLQLIPHGRFKAVILTYIISSLLHGVNIQLSAVLLTLGFATYAEHTIRHKVADIFDACVLANSCTDCTHRHNNRNVLVIGFNLSFRVLGMLHLAYLGILLDGFVDKPEIGASIKTVHERWSNLDYLSHWIILVTFGLGAII
ncbi:protein-serine O-palmitoleoyltransferase porcupine [Contarinia nasturtii]|uniref:protein-serine O-palmitoleoyltransferase porcupine n=1 Tax=Contarinia nasturtii TaxID=265458 RepID=UPI0012D3813A|nr:protein-serine O-palmitoleoyltransferase porcupine [Contarinia nasturtii]XP_031630289.1 protein-serine O-palmitoleoyltransferase porcupine [Contarinia nasturtii]